MLLYVGTANGRTGTLTVGRVSQWAARNTQIGRNIVANNEAMYANTYTSLLYLEYEKLNQFDNDDN